MNDFKESLKVERENTGKIVITEQLSQLLIEVMKGNMSKKELMEITGIGDKGTVELKLEELVAEQPQLKQLYNEYIAKKREDFAGYDFRAEAIEMLRKDYSQTSMAQKIGIARRSFSTKMKKLQQENIDNILGKLLEAHAQRKEKREKMTEQELIQINVSLDEYEEQYPVGLSKYEKRNPLEAKRENLERVISLIESLKHEGTTIKELNEKRIISEASYRKYRIELESLNKMLNGEQEKEQ